MNWHMEVVDLAGRSVTETLEPLEAETPLAAANCLVNMNLRETGQERGFHRFEAENMIVWVRSA